MSRRHSSEEKEAVLQKLIANHGDVARTAAETGISDRTLFRWRQSIKDQIPSPPPPPPPQPLIADNHTVLTPPLYAVGRGMGGGDTIAELPADHTELINALRRIRDRLLKLAEKLSFAIEPAIEEANLSQRVTALSQLIDRVAKIDLMLPVEEEDSQEIRFADSEANEPEETDDETAETADDASPSDHRHQQ